MLNPVKSWDERKDITIPGDAKETLQFALDHFLNAYKEAISAKGAFYVALSGGSTPKALFALLTNPPSSSVIDWKKIHLFWSDERSVPKEDPDSNYHMAMEAGFAKVGIPENQIHRMQAESSIEENALAYEALIKSELKGNGFDYLMLGMGDDGHTASLFPKTEGLNSTGRLVIANYIPEKNTWRMTLTFECINAASHIVLYILGKGKQEKLLEVLTSRKSLYPVQRVGSKDHKALLIVDNDAAKLLIEDKKNDSNS